MTAAYKICIAVEVLQQVLNNYPDDGDWYGCVRNAVASLEESLKSSPPGMGRVDQNKDLSSQKDFLLKLRENVQQLRTVNEMPENLGKVTTRNLLTSLIVKLSDRIKEIETEQRWHYYGSIQ